jgi:hypothetical protein
MIEAEVMHHRAAQLRYRSAGANREGGDLYVRPLERAVDPALERRAVDPPPSPRVLKTLGGGVLVLETTASYSGLVNQRTMQIAVELISTKELVYVMTKFSLLWDKTGLTSIWVG